MEDNAALEALANLLTWDDPTRHLTPDQCAALAADTQVAVVRIGNVKACALATPDMRAEFDTNPTVRYLVARGLVHAIADVASADASE